MDQLIQCCSWPPLLDHQRRREPLPSFDPAWQELDLYCGDVRVACHTQLSVVVIKVACMSSLIVSWITSYNTSFWRQTWALLRWCRVCCFASRFLPSANGDNVSRLSVHVTKLRDNDLYTAINSVYYIMKVSNGDPIHYRLLANMTDWRATLFQYSWFIEGTLLQPFIFHETLKERHQSHLSKAVVCGLRLYHAKANVIYGRTSLRTSQVMQQEVQNSWIHSGWNAWKPESCAGN